MEYLDIYNENHEHIGQELRSVVHEKGLWHNTVHCWLYDKEGNIYFQIRKDEEKLYTTSSGHVDAGEDLLDAVLREVKEEIGLDVNKDKLEKIGVARWQSNSIKKGKPFIDNAFANVYLLKIELDKCNFVFQEDEVLGLAKLKASDVFNLFKRNVKEINAKMLIGSTRKEQKVTEQDFLMDTDIFMDKYGFVLETIVEKVK